MKPKHKKSASPTTSGSADLLTLPATLSQADREKVRDALATFAPELTLLEAAKLSVVLEVFYKQGKMDGFRAAIAALE